MLLLRTYGSVGLLGLVLAWPGFASARSLGSGTAPANSVDRAIGKAGRARVRSSSKAADRRVRPSRKKSRRRIVRRRRRRRYRLVKLVDGPGLRVRTPRRAWATKLTVSHLQATFTAYHEKFPDAPPVWIHDLSRRRGGHLKPHLSHRDGRDVDIRLMLKRHRESYVKATSRTLHLERTWFILMRLIDTGDVEYIFLDRRLQRALDRYARRQGYTPAQLRRIFQHPRRGSGAIIRHWKGHADHMHVRFRKTPRRRPLA